MQWCAGGGRCSEWDKKRLNTLIIIFSPLRGCTLDSIEVMGERTTLVKLSTIMDNCLRPPPSDANVGATLLVTDPG